MTGTPRDPAFQASSPQARPTRDLHTRAAACTLALLPAVVACAWSGHDWTPAIISVPAALPLLQDHARNRGSEGSDSERFFQQMLLLSLWMRTDALAARIGAMLALFVIDLALRRRDAANPFHPVMVACALALLVFPASPPERVLSEGAVPLAATIAAGGAVLLALRCVRWQAPVAMLACAVVAFALGSIVVPAWLGDPALLATFPSFALTAFFIVDDPPRACMRPRARLLSGALTGVVAMAATFGLHALHRDGQFLLLALAGTMLLANAAAPALDRLFSVSRAAGKAGA
ncbi:MAG TPA: RnfABCDGE type electron transport complex subunit D [Xanthomonadaceae bacterium]|jgi:Na+-translocating ferredoxin:NAD+ oxidoreductase RnfD subunit